jgi:pyridoxine 5-phosphate synthase
MIKLGMNVDHVATVRQARGVAYPDPVEAARLAERAGAQAITVHLREDRRHIQDRDLFRIRDAVGIKLNQEMAPIAEMTVIALELRPDEVCLVPERREEVTTEGGLDVAGLPDRLRPVIDQLHDAGIRVSLFIEPESYQVTAASELGADFVELHTGRYAMLADADADRQAGSRINPATDGRQAMGDETRAEFDRLRAAARLAHSLKLKVNVGHGLNYRNVSPIVTLPHIAWAHIGHSIVARAIMVGMGRAVREMVTLLERRKP